MGVQNIEGVASGEALREFTLRLLRDLDALEAMVRSGQIESGVRRIGAEQEVFLVDAAWRAAPASAAVLARTGEKCFVPEVGAFQAEINLDPLEVSPDCLAQMHAQLDARLARLRSAAEEEGVQVVLAGMLPTLRRGDVTVRNMTPAPRYAALDAAIRRLRGGDDYEYRIVGADELLLREHSVMLEAATASFQVHLQVSPEEFAHVYNAAQAAAGPQLASAANSPLLFGQRLWNETRIPVFEQAADTRITGRDQARRSSRVTFGTRWVRASCAEVFREDVSRFPALLRAHAGEDPLAEVAAGRAPGLEALRVHTSTVYRWNRACYGTNGVTPHLRIENRVLPAGPTSVDEVANAAFWLGLVVGIVGEHGDVAARMPFDAARANFHAAARAGLDAQLVWLDEPPVAARDLLLGRLIPLARAGLSSLGVGDGDAERYLGVVRERVASGRTGARWMLDSDAALRASGTRGEQLAAITAASVARERSGAPVHEWSPARLEEAGGPAAAWVDVEQVMVADVPVVRDEDAVGLAALAMDWHGDDYVAVENARGEVVGLIARAALGSKGGPADLGAPVRERMDDAPLCVPPEMPTHAVLALMRDRGAECVLVTRDRRLLGMVTAATLAAAAARRGGGLVA